MKRLNYASLVRHDTYIDATLKRPLNLIRFLRDKTVSEITSEVLTEYLAAELESLLTEMNPGDADLKKEVVNLLKNRFDRL